MIPAGYERRCLLAIFETVLPSGAAERMPFGAADVPMGRFLEDFFRHAPAQVRFGLRACTWLVALSAPFVLGRFRTFLGLAPGERLELLARFGRSSSYLVREVPLLFKTVACLAYCGLPDVQSRLGISPVDATPPSWARAHADASPGRRSLPTVEAGR